MNAMYEVCERFYDELEDIAKKEKWSMSDIELIDTLTHAIKSIKTVKAMEDSGYSHGSTYRGYGGSYGDEHFRTDSRKTDNYGYRGYSRDSAVEDMMKHLEKMIDKAETEEQRRAIQKCMNELSR